MVHFLSGRCLSDFGCAGVRAAAGSHVRLIGSGCGARNQVRDTQMSITQTARGGARGFAGRSRTATGEDLRGASDATTDPAGALRRGEAGNVATQCSWAHAACGSCPTAAGWVAAPCSPAGCIAVWPGTNVVLRAEAPAVCIASTAATMASVHITRAERRPVTSRDSARFITASVPHRQPELRTPTPGST